MKPSSNWTSVFDVVEGIIRLMFNSSKLVTLGSSCFICSQGWWSIVRNSTFTTLLYRLSSDQSGYQANRCAVAAYRWMLGTSSLYGIHFQTQLEIELSPAPYPWWRYSKTFAQYAIWVVRMVGSKLWSQKVKSILVLNLFNS